MIGITLIVVDGIPPGKNDVLDLVSSSCSTDGAADGGFVATSTTCISSWT